MTEASFVGVLTSKGVSVGHTDMYTRGVNIENLFCIELSIDNELKLNVE